MDAFNAHDLFPDLNDEEIMEYAAPYVLGNTELAQFLDASKDFDPEEDSDSGDCDLWNASSPVANTEGRLGHSQSILPDEVLAAFARSTHLSEEKLATDNPNREGALAEYLDKPLLQLQAYKSLNLDDAQALWSECQFLFTVLSQLRGKITPPSIPLEVFSSVCTNTEAKFQICYGFQPPGSGTAADQLVSMNRCGHNHVFHSGCIANWVSGIWHAEEGLQSIHNSCPMCRERLI